MQPDRGGRRAAAANDNEQDADVLTVDEAARWLRVGRNRIYEAIGRGEIPHLRIGRSIRLSRAAIVHAWRDRAESRLRSDIEDDRVPRRKKRSLPAAKTGMRLGELRALRWHVRVAPRNAGRADQGDPGSDGASHDPDDDALCPSRAWSDTRSGGDAR